MTGNELSEEEVTSWGEFWATCARLLAIYPDRPAAMSGETEAKQLERQLKMLAEERLPLLCESDYWLVDASVGKGNRASGPWVAIFDSRESTSAQQGVYLLIHLSPQDPIGVRIGLGVSVTAFKSQADEKAAEVHSEMLQEEREELSNVGFVDIVEGDGPRVEMGTGNLAKKYARGMLFERFVSLDELTSTPRELTFALKSLVTIYRSWVDRTRKQAGNSIDASFLDLMRAYAVEKVVFLSPNRDARYYVSGVDETGCTVERLDSDKAERVTESGYQSRRDWLRDQGGSANREKLDNTVAQHMCYLQAAEMCLESDRRTARYLPDHQAACEQFISLIRSMQTITLYKPVILALVIEAVRDGDLTRNRITFDWLLPRFLERLREHGQEVAEQQLAEGFGRLAADLFWLLAHNDPSDPISTDNPTPGQIRRRISHARLHEAFWNAIQKHPIQQQILDAIGEKWWPQMTSGSSQSSELATAVEQLIKDIAAEGFIYHPWQIATYITALRTKPFVILAGVSGTGKSKLPKLVAELTGGEHERISVRPDWTDSSDVLGYVDIQGDFQPGVFLQTARQASNDPDRHYVSLVDEMNLARVEHYFAEVLSTIEDRHASENGGFESGRLFPKNTGTQHGDWATQNIPANMGIVGTVNMDESSHGFSRKVLDRAFTIELSEVDLSWDVSDATAAGTRERPRWPISFWHCPATRLSEADHSSFQFRTSAETATALLQQVNDCLMRCQLQVGYRTRDEVILFLVNAGEIADSFKTREGGQVDPLDLAIMMKVLPRLVGGSNAIRSTLIGLLGLANSGQPFVSEEDANSLVADWESENRPDALTNTKLPRTAARLCLMWDRLTAEGYTSFWL